MNSIFFLVTKKHLAFVSLIHLLKYALFIRIVFIIILNSASFLSSIYFLYFEKLYLYIWQHQYFLEFLFYKYWSNMYIIYFFSVFVSNKKWRGSCW